MLLYKVKQEISLEKLGRRLEGRLTQGNREPWKGFEQRRDMITFMHYKGFLHLGRSVNGDWRQGEQGRPGSVFS